MPLFHVSSADITSNARVKIYPSSMVVQVSNAPIFREPGYEPEKRLYLVSAKGQASSPERSRQSSLTRARASVRDIALCNSFTHFFTWTLDSRYIDRFDALEVKRKVGNFLKNMVRRKQFSYICVPERHKNGAIHIHGLCCPGYLHLERAINPHNGKPLSTNRSQPIFNMSDWKFGFSTCIPIDGNYERTCNYLIKYITKDTDKIFGKWYWSSRDLKKHPDVQLLEAVDYDSFVEANPKAPRISVYRDVVICCIQSQLEVPHETG